MAETITPEERSAIFRQIEALALGDPDLSRETLLQMSALIRLLPSQQDTPRPDDGPWDLSGGF